MLEWIAILCDVISCFTFAAIALCAGGGGYGNNYDDNHGDGDDGAVVVSFTLPEVSLDCSGKPLSEAITMIQGHDLTAGILTRVNLSGCVIFKLSDIATVTSSLSRVRELNLSGCNLQSIAGTL